MVSPVIRRIGVVGAMTLAGAGVAAGSAFAAPDLSIPDLPSLPGDLPNLPLPGGGFPGLPGGGFPGLPGGSGQHSGTHSHHPQHPQQHRVHHQSWTHESSRHAIHAMDCHPAPQPPKHCAPVHHCPPAHHHHHKHHQQHHHHHQQHHHR